MPREHIVFSMEIAENYQSQYPTMKKFFDTVIDAKKHVSLKRNTVPVLDEIA